MIKKSKKREDSGWGVEYTKERRVMMKKRKRREETKKMKTRKKAMKRNKER